MGNETFYWDGFMNLPFTSAVKNTTQTQFLKSNISALLCVILLMKLPMKPFFKYYIIFVFVLFCFCFFVCFCLISFGLYYVCT